ncbi:MAG: hypothetical protein Q4E37_02445 [Tissierellia bacterium]|nr:hypothetical protein [Tissierellia bacterium]
MSLTKPDIDPAPLQPCRERFFKDFLRKRSELIKSYESGKISKQEFLLGNYKISNQSNIKPFFQVDSYEKGIFNYQYYNCMAKYYHKLSRLERAGKNRKKSYIRYCSLSDKYYHLKDQAALALLELAEFNHVEAYFVHTASRHLANRLFEVVLLDREEAVFHSVAPWLLERLKEKGVFKEGLHASVIDVYINDSY